MQHMLVVAAHPDDETFMAGGTIAKYTNSGWEVDVIAATRGEKGAKGPFTSLPQKELGDVRQKEMEQAGIVLGVHSVTFLGYKDGQLSTSTPGDLEDAVFKKIMEFVPDVVITSDTSGISNHPDHVRLSYATTYAFQKYAAWVEKKLESKEPELQLFPKLYYACIPRSIVSYAIRKKVLPNESFGKPWRGVDDDTVTTVINIREYKELKEKALKSYNSQTANVERFLKIPGSSLVKDEYFIFRMHGTTEVFMGKNDHVADHL